MKRRKSTPFRSNVSSVAERVTDATAKALAALRAAGDTAAADELETFVNVGLRLMSYSSPELIRRAAVAAEIAHLIPPPTQ